MSNFRRIASPANPLVKATAKLRTRRGREQQGRIIIDGYREVARAVAAGVTLETLFFPADADLDPHVLGAQDVPRIALSAAAFAKVAFGNRAELVATARPPTTRLDRLQLPTPPTICVLEGIEKPGNLGAILRSADAAGIDAVVLLDPVTDLFNPNAIRASLGTIFSVPCACASFAEYTRWAEPLRLTHYLARCEEAVDYSDVDYDLPCALVLGSEAKGLRDRWAALENGTAITIPMLGIADSLNVATAATILFYESLRHSRRRGARRPRNREKGK